MSNAICTTTFSTLALSSALTWCSPAHAHDGPHQMTYLQSLLHDLAYADTLATVVSIAAFASVAAWRLSRRKAHRAKG